MVLTAQVFGIFIGSPCANCTLYLGAAAIALYLTFSSAVYAFSTPLGERASMGTRDPYHGVLRRLLTRRARTLSLAQP